MSKVHIKISVKPEWDNIGTFREFLNSFFTGKIDDDKIYDVSFIVSELFENAIKYSAKGNVSIEINQLGNKEDEKMEILVQNRVEKDNFTKLMYEFIQLSNESLKDIYTMKYSSDAFWEAKSGALGLIMLSDKCVGKIALSLKDDIAKIKCDVALNKHIEQ